ncbi:hypothetical protein EMCRGX_G033171 [Ephydatia muelleri]
MGTTSHAEFQETYESHEESESQYDFCEDDPCEDDHCALGDDTVDCESDSNMDFMDTDMNGDTTDETYYPFPSKIFALLYMLVKGTQQVSEQTLAFVWFILQEMGVKTPSLGAVKRFKLPGTKPTVRHVNKEGVPFYTIPLATSIEQFLGCSDIAEALVRFPVHTQDRFTEMFHGRHWCTDERYFTPMVVLNDGTHIFVRDCISFHHPLTGTTKGMVVKFFQQLSSPYLTFLVMLIHLAVLQSGSLLLISTDWIFRLIEMKILPLYVAREQEKQLCSKWLKFLAYELNRPKLKCRHITEYIKMTTLCCSFLLIFIKCFH